MNFTEQNEQLTSTKKIANRYLFAILSFVVLVIIDQVSKYIVSNNMSIGESIPIIPNIFEIHYIHNPGAAWGLFENQQFLFFICTIIVLIVGIMLYVRCVKLNQFRMLQIDLVLILSGAIGNFIDRIRFQYVIDFLYFKLIDFPVFNIADCYVTIGFFWAIILILFVYKEEDFESIISLSKHDTN